MIPQAGGFVSSETMVSAAILTGYTGTASNMLVKVNDYSAYLTGTNMMTGAMGQANYQSIKGSSKGGSDVVIGLGLLNSRLYGTNNNVGNIKENASYKNGKNNFENEIPRSGEEWETFLKEKYGSENVVWESKERSILIDGSHLEKGRLKANVIYKTGEHDYIYKTNENGLIVNANTDNLQLKMHEGRLNHNPNTYGKETGDHAGHLFGDRFGGLPKLDNLVSQAQRVNQSDYNIIENQWAKAIENGKKVIVDININYDQGSMRPASFDVLYTIDDIPFVQTISN